MMQTIELPIWLFALILLFATFTALTHLLLPSVRWFFRRRLEKAVARINRRLTRPINPFKLVKRYDMIQRLIYDPQVAQAISDHANINEIPENVAFEQARSYAREIVPGFSAFAYFGIGIRAARWLATALYNVHTGLQNDEYIRRIPSDATVVFVMNHRSNMDYVLVTYLAAQASALSYAVGEWARVWPLSRLIKSMGAYFVSHKSEGTLYRKVLARYVQMATHAGVTQAVFPEGGLTVDGKLKPLKMGFLSYILGNYDPNERDIFFVPVAINYDWVLEDRVLIAASQRGDRRFKAKISVIMTFTLTKLWEKLSGRFTKFGSAAVVFGEPMSLRAFEPQLQIEPLAIELEARIKDVMPLLPVPLLAKVILSVEGPILQERLVKASREMLPRDHSLLFKENEELFYSQMTEALSQMLSRGMISDNNDGVIVADENRDLLQFYANSLDSSDRAKVIKV